MYREFFSGMTSTTLPLVTMAFFFVAFALVLVRLFLLRKRRDYDPVAALPLDDGSTTERSHSHRSANEVKA